MPSIPRWEGKTETPASWLKRKRGRKTHASFDKFCAFAKATRALYTASFYSNRLGTDMLTTNYTSLSEADLAAIQVELKKAMADLREKLITRASKANYEDLQELRSVVELLTGVYRAIFLPRQSVTGENEQVVLDGKLDGQVQVFEQETDYILAMEAELFAPINARNQEFVQSTATSSEEQSSTGYFSFGFKKPHD